jgi:hypothetical protein
MHLGRRKRSRSDSSSHRIADKLAAPERGRRLGQVAARQIREGAVVTALTIPSGSGDRPDVSVTAAAQVVYGGTLARPVKRPAAQTWQKEAWELRREIGEFRFSGDRVARAVSLCRLFVAEVPEQDEQDVEPLADGPVYELGQQLFGSKAHVQQAMKKAGQHLGFNGETLLVISQDPESKQMTWQPYSSTEVTGSGNSQAINDGVTQKKLTDHDLVVRCWTPDPEQSGLADCAARAVLPVARELRGLTQHTSAQIDSRLAGAGLLIVPQSIEVLAGQGSPQEEGDQLDPFVWSLLESMTVPIANRD